MKFNFSVDGGCAQSDEETIARKKWLAGTASVQIKQLIIYLVL